MNPQQFTPDEQASFTQALRYGLDYIATLNSYQKAQLADLAREKLYRVVQVQTERFVRHPYPPQEAGQLDYWLNSSADYVAAQEILALLAEPAPTEAPTAKATPTAEATSANTEQPRKATKKQVANLQPPLTIEVVKAMLAGLQITKEGETAAALSALVASGKLTGDASKVHRWCGAAAISPLPCRRTVSNKLEYREGGQFSNPSERRIFNEVLRQAKDIR